MNLTKTLQQQTLTCEYDRNIAEFDWKLKYNKYHHNDEHEPGEFDQKLENISTYHSLIV